MRISSVYKTQSWHFISAFLGILGYFRLAGQLAFGCHTEQFRLSQDVYKGIVKAATTHDFFSHKDLQSNTVRIVVLNCDVYLRGRASQD